MMTKEVVRAMEIQKFLGLSEQKQFAILTQVDINELKNPDDFPLLKKYIAMNVLMKARFAAEDHSRFNLTAHFRDFLGSYKREYKFNVSRSFDHSDSRISGLSSDSKSTVPLSSVSESERNDEITENNGYRFFHMSEIGFFNGNRKIFDLGVDQDNNIITKRINTKEGLQLNSSQPIHSELVTWDRLNEEDQLTALLAEIKKETSYENTLGYDLLCVVMTCTNALLYFGWFRPLFMPLALLVNLVIYPVVLPPLLVLVAIEHLIINPIKWVLESNEYDFVVEELTSPATAAI
jgi:cytochrome c oxidase subunit IV